MTNATNVGLGNIIIVANDFSGGIFANIIIILIFVIAFLSLKWYDTKTAFAAASYVTAVLAIIFNTLNVVHPILIVLVFVFVAISTAFLFIGERSYGV